MAFELGQALSMKSVLAPLWLAGAVGPFVDRRLAPARFLSLAFVLTTAFYFLQRGTNYYLFPVYPDDVRGRRGLLRTAGVG